MRFLSLVFVAAASYLALTSGAGVECNHGGNSVSVNVNVNTQPSHHMYEPVEHEHENGEYSIDSAAVPVMAHEVVPAGEGAHEVVPGGEHEHENMKAGGIHPEEGHLKGRRRLKKKEREMQKVFKEVVELENKWAEYFGNNQMEKVVDMYSDDAVILPAGAPEVKGKPNMKTLFDSFYTAGARKFTSTTTEVSPMGKDPATGRELFYEMGNFQMFDKDGKQMEDGKYIVVWVKELDGRLLLHRDIENSNSGS